MPYFHPDISLSENDVEHLMCSNWHNVVAFLRLREADTGIPYMIGFDHRGTRQLTNPLTFPSHVFVPKPAVSNRLFTALRNHRRNSQPAGWARTGQDVLLRLDSDPLAHVAVFHREKDRPSRIEPIKKHDCVLDHVGLVVWHTEDIIWHTFPDDTSLLLIAALTGDCSICGRQGNANNPLGLLDNATASNFRKLKCLKCAATEKLVHQWMSGPNAKKRKTPDYLIELTSFLLTGQPKFPVAGLTNFFPAKDDYHVFKSKKKEIAERIEKEHTEIVDAVRRDIAICALISGHYGDCPQDVLRLAEPRHFRLADVPREEGTRQAETGRVS